MQPAKIQTRLHMCGVRKKNLHCRGIYWSKLAGGAPDN